MNKKVYSPPLVVHLLELASPDPDVYISGKKREENLPEEMTRKRERSGPFKKLWE